MVNVKRIEELSGHQNPVYTVENSQKPHLFFTGGNDKGIVEWNLKTNTFVKVLMPVNSSAYALHAPSFSPVLAVGERSGKVQIFNFEDQKTEHVLIHHVLPVFDIQSVSSKKELILSSEDGTVSVWNMNGYEKIHKFRVSPDTVRVMAISPDEKLIAFGCKDNFIRIYNLEDYSLHVELPGHTMPVTSVQFSPDGTKLFSGSRDAHLKVWRVSDFTLLHSIPAHLFAIYDIKFHPTKPYFATASRDKTIKIWSTDDLRLCRIISREKGFETHYLSVNKLVWSKYNENLISVGDDKLVYVWDVTFKHD
ncbi:MAG TPA: WD40 repeat domain-containing protein [Sphingobacteriaceae bacterium]|nr:WD40 repeat domain-containing protein [Sphingobacteriaceae bacterium]